MTETRFTWQWLFVVAGIGLLVGAAFGLIVGWVVLPVAGSAVDVSALNAGAQNDYIVLVANTFAYDDDLPRAKERLTLLKDPNIAGRVENLAKALNTRQDPNAANLAELAIELGSTDSSLQVLASSMVKVAGGSPTKYAQLDIAPTEAPQPTAAATNTSAPTVTATEQPTPSATKREQAVAPKNTPRPAATSQPQAAAALMPEFKPAFPSQWWPTIQFAPATEQPGQQYWRLVNALYCEPEDVNPDPACANRPGGGNDYSIYVSLIDTSGKRTEGELVAQLPDGTTSDEGTSAKAKSADDMCNCNYSMQISNYIIKVKGLPSDVISGFCACSVHRGWPSHAHVRYFLVFQLITR